MEITNVGYRARLAEGYRYAGKPYLPSIPVTWVTVSLIETDTPPFIANQFEHDTMDISWETAGGIVPVGLLVIAGILVLAGIDTIAGYEVIDAGQFAMGYLAAGNFSLGVLSAGIFSVGIFSAGIFSVGIFAIGVFSIGLLSFGIYAGALFAAHRYIREGNA